MGKETARTTLNSKVCRGGSLSADHPYQGLGLLHPSLRAASGIEINSRPAQPPLPPRDPYAYLAALLRHKPPVLIYNPIHIIRPHSPGTGCPAGFPPGITLTSHQAPALRRVTYVDIRTRLVDSGCTTADTIQTRRPAPHRLTFSSCLAWRSLAPFQAPHTAAPLHLCCPPGITNSSLCPSRDADRRRH